MPAFVDVVVVLRTSEQIDVNDPESVESFRQRAVSANSSLGKIVACDPIFSDDGGIDGVYLADNKASVDEHNAGRTVVASNREIYSPIPTDL